MIKTRWRLWNKCKFNVIWEKEYKKINEWWVFYLEPNKRRVVGTSALMNMQSGAVHSTGRTMQMNSFNVHSGVDHAWKHLVNVSVGNISELQVHRRMGEHRGWKNEHFCTCVLQYFGGKKRKDILSQQFHFGTRKSYSAEMVSNASLAFKASEVIHPSSCDWCHCAFMLDSFLFKMCLFMFETAVFPGGIVSVVEPVLLSASLCRATCVI